MKIFERILKDEVISLVSDKLDPLQFAYQAGRGVEDAKAFILDKIYKHLEKPQSHARLLFADFSSAFNKMQPHILIDQLSSYFKLPDQLLLLLLNFLTDRKQRVLVNGTMSNLLVSNTGSPQGCVLSPLLFILYTDSCRSQNGSSHLVKFSDDTALLTLLEGSESDHGSALPDFVKWCEENYLDLNVSKTKELVVDFRKHSEELKPSIIQGNNVEIVDTYKYLGTVFDSKLKFDVNTENIMKKGQQRIHLLRRLNSFNVCKETMCMFYQSFIESILTFSFICWFGGLSIKDKNCLYNIVKVCSKIIGIRQRDLSSLWERKVIKRAQGIISQPDHVLSSDFVLMPSGRRFAAPLVKTNRRAKSFLPSAIRLLNREGM